MRNYVPLSVALLLAFGAGLLARHGWLAKDQGYFFLGAVLLIGAVVPLVRVTTTIVRNWRRSGE
jgi:hypothetical protein